MSDPSPSAQIASASAAPHDAYGSAAMQQASMIDLMQDGSDSPARLALVVLAAVTFVALAAFSAWWLQRDASPTWLQRRPAPAPILGTALARAVSAGAVAGLAIIPPGLLLLAIGFPVGVYAELALRSLLGSAIPSTLFIAHMATSVGLALPFVAGITASRRLAWLRHAPTAWGALYGAAAWLVVNALALPLAFGQPTPWELGISSIWPSLAVHVIFGAVLGAVTGSDARRKRWEPVTTGAPAVA